MNSAAYDAIAAWYDQYLRGPFYLEVVLPALFELIGDVSGLKVLDLACGQGLVARELARRGAHVTGVDLSTKLIELAERYEQAEPAGIQYVQDDAQRLTGLADDSFDAAVCNLALMDIPDLSATFRAVQRVLERGGRLVFSITHPCFEAPHAQWVNRKDDMVTREVTRYLTEGFWLSENPDGVRGRVGAYHRTLSTYLNALADAGFVLERVIEPKATGRRAEQVPGNGEIPSLLAVRARLL